MGIDEKTYNIDVSKLAERISRKTKCIMPVSLFGQMAALTEINKIANDYSKKLGHKIYVLEDAAQSFGARNKSGNSCALTDLACTSFFPAKPLGCYGDGGAVFTNDLNLSMQIRELLNHG